MRRQTIYLIGVLIVLLLMVQCIANATTQEETPMATKTPVGTNIKYEVTKGNKLVIEIDLNEEHGLSKSQKTLRIASSEGNKRLYDAKNNSFMVGLNCYKYPEE